MVLPLIPIAAALFGGAYVGNVIGNATESPDTVINSANTTVDNMATAFSTRNILLYGAIGFGGFWLYKQIKKK